MPSFTNSKQERNQFWLDLVIRSRSDIKGDLVRLTIGENCDDGCEIKMINRRIDGAVADWPGNI